MGHVCDLWVQRLLGWLDFCEWFTFWLDFWVPADRSGGPPPSPFPLISQLWGRVWVSKTTKAHGRCLKNRCLGPRSPQDGSKMAARLAKMAQGWSKAAQDRPKRAPRWSQVASRGPQDGPKTAQDGPRWSQDGRRWFQDGRNGPQDGSQMAPRCL